MIYSPLCYTECVAASNTGTERRCADGAVYVILLSVMAGIVTHYACKWLDGE